jgi:glutamate racemase
VSKPIAVIDSGVGGLTVVQEIMRQLPREEVVYFGDTARCPYGPRSRDEVRQFSYQLIDFLNQFNPKMLVIACNTATAVILDELRVKSDIPIIGVIHPGVRAAIKSTVIGRIGVIGTIGTIESGVYQEALRQVHPDLYIKSLACPQLVPLVEDGMFSREESFEVVKEALEPLQNENIDSLILGCTHYPLLAPVIQEIMGEHVNLISSADETAREVSTILFHKNLFSKTFGLPTHRFFVSGKLDVFKAVAESWLKLENIKVEQVDLS